MAGERTTSALFSAQTITARIFKFRKITICIRGTGHIQINARVQDQESGFKALVYDYTAVQGNIIHKSSKDLVLYWEHGECEYVPGDHMFDVLEWLKKHAQSYMPKSHLINPIVEEKN